MTADTYTATVDTLIFVLLVAWFVYDVRRDS